MKQHKPLRKKNCIIVNNKSKPVRLDPKVDIQ